MDETLQHSVHPLLYELAALAAGTSSLIHEAHVRMQFTSPSRYNSTAEAARLDFQVASALPNSRALESNSSSTNHALLQSPRFRQAYEAYDSGQIGIDRFRGELRGLGVVETAEARRLLSGATVPPFTQLLKSLNQGTDIPLHALGKPSASFSPTQNTALQSNIVQHVSCTGSAREVRDSLYASSPGLRAAISGSDEQQDGKSEHYSSGASSSPFLKAREVRRDAYVDSGSGALLAGRAATLPAAAMDGVKTRAANLLCQVSAGGMDEHTFIEQIGQAIAHVRGQRSVTLPDDLVTVCRGAAREARRRPGQPDCQALLTALDPHLQALTALHDTSRPASQAVVASAQRQRSHPGLLSEEGPQEETQHGSPGAHLGSFSGRRMHSARLHTVFGESTPDNRDDILPVGLSAAAAERGVDPRRLVQRRSLHPSRTELAPPPFATG